MNYEINSKSLNELRNMSIELKIKLKFVNRTPDKDAIKNPLIYTKMIVLLYDSANCKM